MRKLIGLALILAASLPVASPTGAEGPDEIVVFNRDRSGSCPDANPPLTFDGKTGKNILWKTRLPTDPAGGAPLEQKIAEEHRRKRWRWFGAASPWAEGDRLYFRSYDFLWCIGRK